MTESMLEPEPTELPGVIHVRIYGLIAKSAQKVLTLGYRKADPDLKQKILEKDEEERVARREMGLDAFSPQRHPFAELHPETKGGILRLHMGGFLTDMFLEGYFLIAADNETDDTARNITRFVFSRLEEDRHLTNNYPTTEKVLWYFRSKVWRYVHVHDNRRIHPRTSLQIGNNVFDLLGGVSTIEACKENPRYKVKYRVMRFDQSGEINRGLYSYDIVSDEASDQSTRRRLAYRLGDEIR